MLSTAAGPSAATPSDYLATTGEAVLASAIDLARHHATGVDVVTDLRIGGGSGTSGLRRPGQGTLERPT
jgi:hypothetical protein